MKVMENIATYLCKNEHERTNAHTYD